MFKVLRKDTMECFLVPELTAYQNTAYLIEPDLSGVAEVEKRFWKVDGLNVVEMTQPEKDIVIAADLEAAKQEKLTIVDLRTTELIDQGFAFDDHTFSLSQNAQLNWNSLFTLMIAGTIGPTDSYEISTRDPDSDKYLLTPENRAGFFGLAFTSVSTYISSGRAIRDAIKSATTIEEVDAIVDPR